MMALITPATNEMRNGDLVGIRPGSSETVAPRRVPIVRATFALVGTNDRSCRRFTLDR
jgi:hypothetical protein